MMFVGFLVSLGRLMGGGVMLTMCDESLLIRIS